MEISDYLDNVKLWYSQVLRNKKLISDDAILISFKSIRNEINGSEQGSIIYLKKENMPSLYKDIICLLNELLQTEHEPNTSQVDRMKKNEINIIKVIFQTFANYVNSGIEYSSDIWSLLFPETFIFIVALATKLRVRGLLGLVYNIIYNCICKEAPTCLKYHQEIIDRNK